MSWIDWLIVIIPVSIVYLVGWRSRRYAKGVADFLSAGRLCGRYVISMGDVANALSIIGLVAFVEVNYKSGLAVGYWGAITAPLGLLLSLTGYCLYRFRETKAMSLGQFLEMRYNRPFRIFASALRTVSEILANMIMPAIAARFFIFFFGLPETFSVFGYSFSTFTAVMLVCLTLAISLICMGGTLTLVITDALQGMICYPIMAVFVIFLLTRFSWYGEIVPTLLNRVEGQSFINPFDIHKLRDFNIFMLLLGVFTTIWHRASWIGAGMSGAAKSPHEQKLANILGTFRNYVMSIMYVLIGVSIVTLLNHRGFAPQARAVRMEIAEKVSTELIKDPAVRGRMIDRMEALDTSAESYRDKLSNDLNNDTPWMNAAHETFREEETGLTSGEANQRYQGFRTMYHQLMLAVSMRHLLPPIMMGLFCLMMILAMISTDDTRIFSASLTMTQDVILPLRKKPFTPEQHVRALRLTSIGVGVIFLIGSKYMAQMDYINLFVTLMTMMWMAGCGPVMIFGLYSRFGTTAGAFASLGTGMGLAGINIFLQRNWAARVYPWLEKMGWVERVGAFLEAASKPFHPIVVWKMDAVKFPINSFESYFIAMMITLIVYCVVSWATRKEPFNLDRMLHRGIYNTDGDIKEKTKWTVRNALSKIIGITPAYTRGDKAIAWGVFGYSFLYSFSLMFLGSVIWNTISPWPAHWWGTYMLIGMLIVPGTLAVFFTFLFMIGGVR
ncbi:MAG: sodium:panthothenate symporter, partial [Kiritimatiellia bacterium]|nr:sodium:panthothenate symporter [Kiritimatiellia bacterium]